MTPPADVVRMVIEIDGAQAREAEERFTAAAIAALGQTLAGARTIVEDMPGLLDTVGGAITAGQAARAALAAVIESLERRVAALEQIVATGGVRHVV